MSAQLVLVSQQVVVVLLPAPFLPPPLVSSFLPPLVSSSLSFPSPSCLVSQVTVFCFV